MTPQTVRRPPEESQERRAPEQAQQEARRDCPETCRLPGVERSTLRDKRDNCGLLHPM